MSTENQLPLREKLSYGFGDLASVLYWQTFMVYLTYFYTDVFGIAALAAGAMLGLSRSLDAFFDPVMGMLADRTKTRWGKFRPYLLWLCVPFAVVGMLTFTTPGAAITAPLDAWFGGIIRSGLVGMSNGFHFLHLNSLSETARSLSEQVTGGLVWAILTYNALMLLYTAINIPYTAMLGVLSPNPTERTTLSSIKFVFAFAAGMIVSATVLPMAKVFGNGNPARGWQITFLVIGLAAIVFFLITFFNTRERVSPPKAQKTSVARDLGDLFTNVPWLVLLATTITFILFVALRSSVTVHYFKYYVGTQILSFPGWMPWIGGTQEWHLESLVSFFNTSGQLASLLGVVLVPFYAKLVGRKTAFISMFVVAIVSTLVFYVLKPNQVLAIMAVNLLGSITGGPLSALLWAMYADTADYAEWKRGRRATGLVFSASIFSQKQGWAIGAAVALFLMARVGFRANVAQTPESLHGLVMLMSVFPAVLGVVSILIVIFYPLNETKVAQIEADLKARRIEAGEPTPA
jgi:GPH family glycoside/pentoside/hexuronide:cation symporter